MSPIIPVFNQRQFLRDTSLMRHIKKFKNPTIINSPAYELFILGLCILALVIFAEEMFFHVSGDVLYVLQTVDFAICVVFIFDFLLRLLIAENRIKYLMTWGWLDLLSSIPAIELFRIGRLARVLRIFKGIRSVRNLANRMSASRSEFALSLATLVTVTTVLSGSVAVLIFERGVQGSGIHDGRDAIWWAVVTMTTVGYGDYVPVTTGGRVVAMVLMTLGVAIFATYTGFVATMLLEPAESEQNEELDQIRLELKELREQLATLNSILGKENGKGI